MAVSPNNDPSDSLAANGLWQYVWASRQRLWPIFVLATVKVAVVAPLPLLFMHIVDHKVAARDFAGALWLGLDAIGLIAIHAAVAFCGIRLLSKRIPDMIADLRGRVFMKLQFIHFAFLDRVQVGRLLSRYSFDTQKIEGAVIPMVQDILPSLLHSAALLIPLAWLNLKLTFLIVLILPLIFVIRIAFMRRVAFHNEASRRAQEGLTGMASEFISAIRLVRGFGQEKSVVETMDETSEAFTQSRQNQLLANQSMATTAFVLTKLLQVAVVVAGAILTIRGTMTFGTLLAFISALPHITEPINLITKFSQTYSLGSVSFQSIKRLLDSVYVEDWTGTRKLKPLRGELLFEQVDFSYREEGPVVLTGFDLKIAAGERVAFVGPSGSGKSTVVNLVLGLYKPTRGRILIDGVPQAEISMRAFRRKCAIVMQENLLLSGTIYDNIRFGKPGATEDEIQEAARQANAESFIRNLPDGIATRVGERGVSLSGGQRQRIAIARALLRNPRILILDEATSALDYESERAVQEALDRLAAGRTVITIAHRLSTVRSADRIIVLHEGRIVETGAFDELVARDFGLFRELLSSQNGIG
ncbi:MAG: ABC transporter ATP-binding protein [Opitutaceae bacterium]